MSDITTQEQYDESAPEWIEDTHQLKMLEFALDSIREGGSTNMYGGASALQQVYPELSDRQAREMLLFWMASFSFRNDLVGQ